MIFNFYDPKFQVAIIVEMSPQEYELNKKEGIIKNGELVADGKIFKVVISLKSIRPIYPED